MTIRQTANQLFRLLGEKPLEPLQPVDGYVAQFSDKFLADVARDLLAFEAMDREKKRG